MSSNIVSRFGWFSPEEPVDEAKHVGSFASKQRSKESGKVWITNNGLPVNIRAITEDRLTSLSVARTEYRCS